MSARTKKTETMEPAFYLNNSDQIVTRNFFFGLTSWKLCYGIKI